MQSWLEFQIPHSYGMASLFINFMRPFSPTFPALTGLLALALSMISIAGGPFAPPKDGPSSFRRDRIPLEIDDIRRLSNSLATMASVIEDDRAKDRRLAAQCIALALALEPRNRDARRLLKVWEDGRMLGRKDFDAARKSLEYAASLIEWLENDRAGRDAHSLATCLRDVVSRVGASETEFRELGAQNMLGDWNDFVPALSAYEKQERPSDPGPERDANTDPNFGTNPPVTDPEKGEFKLAFNRAEITIPMWHREINPERAQNWVIKPSRMLVTAEHDQENKNEPFRLQVGNNIYNEQMLAFSNHIKGVLHQALGDLPAGLKVNIGSAALDEVLHSGQPQSISAAAVVLAGSVVRGVPPDPDTTVIGRVDAQGNYLPSSKMWKQLKILGNGKGQRLVVPAKSRQYFEAMLTMDQISYFLNYEVVSASNIEELLNAAATQPEGVLAVASEQFGEIHKVAPADNVRTFVANSHVRKRLQEIVKACPQHLSAELLLMHANSSRPFNITREVFCSEMKCILEPFEQVQAIAWDAAAERSYQRLPIAQMIKEARDKVATLERYVGREERDLYQAVDLVFAEMREYEKALSERGEWDYITGVLSRSSRTAEQVLQNYVRMLDEAMNQ